MISDHSARSIPLPVGFRIFLSQYKYLLLLSLLWCREAIFEPKGVKLSSFPECRIRTQGLRLQIASRLNACWQTDWAIADKAKTDTRQPIPMISGHSSHSTPMPIGFNSWLWRYVCCSMLWHRQASSCTWGQKEIRAKLEKKETSIYFLICNVISIHLPFFKEGSTSLCKYVHVYCWWYYNWFYVFYLL